MSLSRELWPAVGPKDRTARDTAAKTASAKNGRAKTAQTEAPASPRSRRPDLDDRPAESERQLVRRGSGADPTSGQAALAKAKAAPSQQPEEKDGHLRVVEAKTRPRLSARRQARLLVAAVAVMSVAVAFTLVYLHVVLAQRQFELDRLTTQANQAQTRYQGLQLRVAQLSSPERIISTAEGKLGMRQPDSVTYLAPSPGSTASGAFAQSGTPPSAPAGDTDWAQIKPYLEDTP